MQAEFTTLVPISEVPILASGIRHQFVRAEDVEGRSFMASIVDGDDTHRGIRNSRPGVPLASDVG